MNFHVTAEKSGELKDHRFFEQGPMNAEIAIKISHVSKVQDFG